MSKTAPDLARIRRAVLWATPGQLDAGFASLATFVTGIAAVRALGTEGLAAYALLSAAYRVVNQIPVRLVFSPSEIIAMDSDTERRLGSLAFSVGRGGLLSVVTALAVPLGALMVADDLSRDQFVALGLTAALLAVVSPIQDHVRTVFHMSDLSWMAAVTSLTNLLGTGIALFLLYSSISWAVFGALFIGNLLSLVVAGLWVVRRRPSRSERPGIRQLWELGGWLTLTGFGKTGISYLLTATLGFVAGLAALGFVEAARVVAQPVRVFAQGVMTQVGPKLIKAGSIADGKLAGRWERRYLYLLGFAALPYFVLVAWDWALNPFAAIAPRAYELSGLVAATIFVVVGAAFVDSLRFQLFGARRQQTVAGITFAMGALELAVTTSGAVIGAYAAPLAAIVTLLATSLWFWRTLRTVFVSPAHAA